MALGRKRTTDLPDWDTFAETPHFSPPWDGAEGTLCLSVSSSSSTSLINFHGRLRRRGQYLTGRPTPIPAAPSLRFPWLGHSHHCSLVSFPGCNTHPARSHESASPEPSWAQQLARGGQNMDVTKQPWTLGPLEGPQGQGVGGEGRKGDAVRVWSPPLTPSRTRVHARSSRCRVGEGSGER